MKPGKQSRLSIKNDIHKINHMVNFVPNIFLYVLIKNHFKTYVIASAPDILKRIIFCKTFHAGEGMQFNNNCNIHRLNSLQRRKRFRK